MIVRVPYMAQNLIPLERLFQYSNLALIALKKKAYERV